MVPRALGGLGHRRETFTTVLLLLSVWSCGLLSPAGFSRLRFFLKKERHCFRTRKPAFCRF